MVHIQVIAGDDVKSSIGKLMFMYMKMIEEGTKALYVYINPFDKGIDEDCDRFKAFNDKMTEQVENIIERISKALESQESVTVIAIVIEYIYIVETLSLIRAPMINVILSY